MAESTAGPAAPARGPFGYGVVDGNGDGYFDEACLFDNASDAEQLAEELNDQDDDWQGRGYRAARLTWEALPPDPVDRYVAETSAPARRSLEEELRLRAEMVEGVLHMAVARLGGEVEGAPTHRGNFLQRIDALREMETRSLSLLAVDDPIEPPWKEGDPEPRKYYARWREALTEAQGKGDVLEARSLEELLDEVDRRAFWIFRLEGDGCSLRESPASANYSLARPPDDALSVFLRRALLAALGVEG